MNVLHRLVNLIVCIYGHWLPCFQSTTRIENSKPYKEGQMCNIFCTNINIGVRYTLALMPINRQILGTATFFTKFTVAKSTVMYGSESWVIHQTPEGSKQWKWVFG